MILTIRYSNLLTIRSTLCFLRLARIALYNFINIKWSTNRVLRMSMTNYYDNTMSESLNAVPSRVTKYNIIWKIIVLFSFIISIISSPDFTSCDWECKCINDIWIYKIFLKKVIYFLIYNNIINNKRLVKWFNNRFASLFFISTKTTYSCSDSPKFLAILTPIWLSPTL